MGIRTIAVYSQADRNARHVRMADEAFLVGAAPASDSYLRNGRILSVAKEAGADAVHPGYGFLSENADFAELTHDAGMIFVGPPADAIRSMGLKDRAKEIMQEAGVPVVSGYHGHNQNPEFLRRKAYEIGYPVLIKAVAGGGGKGMRKVEKAIEFDDALDAAKREAKSAFGNDIVLLEKFVENPRHIEIQVFADGHGNVVHLFERDCSLQRRHQKVIEEAPAPGMSQDVRDAMGKAACEAARAVGYVGAGTVEFIADGKHGLTADGFYFMEMNTRLQVEHPVTEMITGTDLVEWQLRVASGEKLPKSQSELGISGHAVEARVYAEDPNAGFLPSIGELIALNFGPESDGFRVDSGVEKGDMISPYYDPMIAKVIVHASTRAEALQKLEIRLKEAQIAGPLNNIAFLAKLCADKSFRAGRFDTSLIDTKLESLIDTSKPDDHVVCMGVSSVIKMLQKRIGEENASAVGTPWRSTDSFQTVGEREFSWEFILDGIETTARVRFDGSEMSLKSGDGRWSSPSNTASTYIKDQKIYVLYNGKQAVFEAKTFEPATDGSTVDLDGIVLVPMHGKVIAVTVVDGDEVEQGDMLFSVEAMKMEHAVLAPHAGRVTNLAISAGSQAENGFPALKLVADA